MGAFRFLWIIACLTVALRLIADVTAGKLFALGGVGVSVSILYFPLTYVLADVVTEVYGYARARAILWVTAFCSLLAGVLYQLVAQIPPAPFFADDAAYTTVFTAAPRILAAGWLAVFLGDLVNNYVLARMKVRSGGQGMKMRLIASTAAGQAVDSVAFYLGALYGIVPMDALFAAIAVNFALKVAFEAILWPLTERVCIVIKAREGVDHFDRDADFTPFGFAEAFGPAPESPRHDG